MKHVALLCSLATVACDESIEGRIGLPDPDQPAEPVLTPEAGALVLEDPATGTLFNLRGEAFEGPLTGEMLEARIGTAMFWFAWSVFYPGSEIWSRDTDVRAGELPRDQTGSSACGGGRDCIPSLPNTGEPTGALAWARPGEDATAYLRDTDLVIGTFIDRRPRAYPHNILWWHEIANDRIGNQWYSVTLCPLTGSALVFDGEDARRSFGVSGNLFNANLVMYDHQTESLWPQLGTSAASGSEAGTRLSRVPHVEMSYGAWKALHPDTLVLSSNTGFSRNYFLYPYGDYRTDPNTFELTNPRPDPIVPNKDMVFGLDAPRVEDMRAYLYDDLEAETGEPRGAVLDEHLGVPVVVVYDVTAGMVRAFSRVVGDQTLDLRAIDFSP